MTDRRQPSWVQGFARYASKSVVPNLWKGLKFAADPSLGNTGAVVHEIIGKRDVTLQSTTAWVYQVGKQALTFNGSSDYADNTSFSVDGNAGGTIAFWFKTTTTQGNKYMISMPENSAGTAGFDVRFSSTTISATVNAASQTTVFDATTDWRDDVWRHVAASYDGINHKLYINGKESDSAANSGPIDAAATEINFARFGTLGEYWAGELSGVLIYDRGLLPTEVRKLYLLGSGGIFRRKPMVIVKAPAAAGLSIPVAMAQYRKFRTPV